MKALQSTRKVLALVGIIGTLATMMGSANAQTWDETHPRRVEVNERLANQNARIDYKEATGQMTPGQAARLHYEDHQIRQEERDMASQNGGHITRGEQRTLNAQENHVSRQISWE